MPKCQNTKMSEWQKCQDAKYVRMPKMSEWQKCQNDKNVWMQRVRMLKYKNGTLWECQILGFQNFRMEKYQDVKNARMPYLYSNPQCTTIFHF